MTVANVGHVDGAEVAQLYLQFPDAAGEPPLQLKGFSKIFLKAGSSARVEFPLESKDLSVWDENVHHWVEQSGKFGIAIGGGLSDIRARETFHNAAALVYV